MKSKILDVDKVINALEAAQFELYIPYHYRGSDDDMTETVKELIYQQSKEMIHAAICSFVIALTIRLKDCEVDNYPCALCYEEEKE